MYDEMMSEAIAEARKAESRGEVPVGAVVEKDGVIIGRGHNLTETLKDPTAHAEMIAIRNAAEELGGWRLPGCNLYVTCEPCAMCAGAIVLARVDKVYIGTMDPKSGACGSVFNIIQERRLNHYAEIKTGIMQQECERMMKDFFKARRTKNTEEIHT
jgi:tRNA(adenine34) deaminase